MAVTSNILNGACRFIVNELKTAYLAVNDIVTGIMAIITGYLSGSIPSAYLATRLVAGMDIRQLGGGKKENGISDKPRLGVSCLATTLTGS